MGTCTSNCPPGFPNAPPNDPALSEMVIGCGPATSISGLVKCPDNGEWETNGTTGSCQYDSSQPGCGLDCQGGSCGKDTMAGHCQIGGVQLRCKRKDGDAGYTADPVQCCQTGAATVGGRTCDPKYRAGANSTSCQRIAPMSTAPVQPVQPPAQPTQPNAPSTSSPSSATGSPAPVQPAQGISTTTVALIVGGAVVGLLVIGGIVYAAIPPVPESRQIPFYPPYPAPAYAYPPAPVPIYASPVEPLGRPGFPAQPNPGLAYPSPAALGSGFPATPAY